MPQRNIMPNNKSKNDLIRLNMVINRLEHDRNNMLQNGDPILSPNELCHLNGLQANIWNFKRQLVEKTGQLKKMRAAYYQDNKKQYRLLNIQI